MTENYRIIKAVCAVCSGTGRVMVPRGIEDLDEYFCSGEFYTDKRRNEVEETCPVCGGTGIAEHEMED